MKYYKEFEIYTMILLTTLALSWIIVSLVSWPEGIITLYFDKYNEFEFEIVLFIVIFVCGIIVSFRKLKEY